MVMANQQILLQISVTGNPSTRSFPLFCTDTTEKMPNVRMVK